MIRPPLFFSIDFNNWFNTRSQSRAFFFFLVPPGMFISSLCCVYIKHNSNLTFWTAVTTEDLCMLIWMILNSQALCLCPCLCLCLSLSPSPHGCRILEGCCCFFLLLLTITKLLNLESGFHVSCFICNTDVKGRKGNIILLKFHIATTENHKKYKHTKHKKHTHTHTHTHTKYFFVACKGAQL
jgi:hypothetical protein